MDRRCYRESDIYMSRLEDLKKCPECKSKRLKKEYSGIFKKCLECGRLYAIVRDKLNIWDKKMSSEHFGHGWIDYDKWNDTNKEIVVFT